METSEGNVLAVATPADIIGKLSPLQLPPSTSGMPLAMLSNEVTAAKEALVQPLQRYPPPHFYYAFTYILG